MNNQTFKFACPHCGQHLEAEPEWVGMEVECPTCGKALTVPSPQPSQESNPHFSSDKDKTTTPNCGVREPVEDDGRMRMPQEEGEGLETDIESEAVTPDAQGSGLSVRYREMILTIIGVVFAPILVRLVFLEPVSRYSYNSSSSTTKPVQYTSAWNALTREQQLAMGKVMYALKLFSGFQQQADNVGGSQATGITFLAGVTAAQFLPQINDDDTPADFKQAWRTYAGYFAAANVGNALAAGIAQNGGGLSAQDLGGISAANEGFAQASAAFYRVLERYGKDNIIRITNEVEMKIDSGLWSANDLLRKKD